MPGTTSKRVGKYRWVYFPKVIIADSDGIRSISIDEEFKKKDEAIARAEREIHEKGYDKEVEQ